jgi:hypothetical protein
MIITLIVAVIGSNALTAITQHYLTKRTRLCADQGLIRDTLAAVTYSLLSGEIERILTKDYATPDERRSLGILYDAYKANGWNGDMSARMDKVYKLRTDCPPYGRREGDRKEIAK